MAEVSSTRLYLGNLPRAATKADIESHFAGHGTGEITEVKLMNGFGFIEYKDPMDARDVVPAFHGSDFMGERMTVQFARGNRAREGAFGERAPRPRRTSHRMQISGLPPDTSWQDLKDFARLSALDVVYSETGRESSGKGYVEFESAADLKTAIEKLDNREFKGNRVSCAVDTSPEGTSSRSGRSRSPPPGGRRPHPPPADDRRPPRGYSPRRDTYGYRERSPRGRDYYDERLPPRDYRSPPRRPIDDYPPPPPRRPGYDDPYRRDYPPVDPYGPGRPYDRPPRDFPPPRDGYPREPYPPRDYDRGRYW